MVQWNTVLPSSSHHRRVKFLSVQFISATPPLHMFMRCLRKDVLLDRHRRPFHIHKSLNLSSSLNFINRSDRTLRPAAASGGGNDLGKLHTVVKQRCVPSAVQSQNGRRDTFQPCSFLRFYVVSYFTLFYTTELLSSGL